MLLVESTFFFFLTRQLVYDYLLLLLLNFLLVLTDETPKWHLLQLLIWVAFKFLTIFFARATFINLQHPTHNSDIFINYFVFIFQCVLMFYYFRLLLNASNCFIITFSFNGFIHELFFLFKNAS